MMAETDSFQKILEKILEIQPALKERLQQEVILPPGDSFTVGNITDALGVAIGKDIVQIIVKNASNVPDELISRLNSLIENLEKRENESPTADGEIRIYIASRKYNVSRLIGTWIFAPLLWVTPMQIHPYCQG
jgi:hypothetical protein